MARASLLFTLSMLMFATTTTAANADYKRLTIGDGWEKWKAVAKQTDPFDPNQVEIVSISKGVFSWSCETMSFEVENLSYRWTYDVDLAFQVDENAVVETDGFFQRRHFYIELTPAYIEQMKQGEKLTAAGRIADKDWVTRSVSLIGFADAYEAMCD